MTEEKLSEIKEFALNKMANSSDAQHNWEHVKRVRGNALRIIKLLGLASRVDSNLMEAICFLHDLIYAEHQTSLKMYFLESVMIKNYLPKVFSAIEISPEERDIIKEAVARHTLSFPLRRLTRNRDNYTKILQDADTIDFFHKSRKKSFLGHARRPVFSKIISVAVNFTFEYGRSKIYKFLNYPELAEVFYRKVRKIDDFYYAEFGASKKKTLFCLPGYSDSTDTYKKLGKKLQGNYRVIILDFPMIHEENRPRNVQSLAGYVTRFVEKLGLEKFTLLGFSFGGLVAIEYCSQNIEKVKELYLLTSLPQFLVSKRRLRIYAFLKPFLVSKTFCRLYLPFNANRFIRKFLGSEKIKGERVELQRMFPVSIFGTLFASLDANLTDKFNSLPVPKTAVFFKDDKILKWKRHEALIETLSCKLVTFENGGHFDNENSWRSISSLWLS